MANIIGTQGNDTLVGTDSTDTINGKAGNDIITTTYGNDTLTGGGGNDIFVYNSGDGTVTITDFGGVGQAINPTAAVIAEVDTIKFNTDNNAVSDFTARNLVLTQNGSNLEISFGVVSDTKIILQNFKLEDLNNLKASGTKPAIGNILFDGETSINDSFHFLDANSTQTSISIKNTVTFLNDLNNNIRGLDNSDDVINGQGGNDKIDGLSGNDLLRGGTGNDTLLGGVGDDFLTDVTGNNSLVGGIGNDELSVICSDGDNTLIGGAGGDRLSAMGSQGNNLLSGGNGNDYLDASIFVNSGNIPSSGNNTLNGGAGDDLLMGGAKGNNLLSGDDGDDRLFVYGYDENTAFYSYRSSGNNTLNGGAGDDTLRAQYSTGNNLLCGGDGNDYLSLSDYVLSNIYDASSGNNTLNGGAGNDTLRAEYSTGNNVLSGGDGNDSLYLGPSSQDTAPAYLVTQTVNGGKGDDVLYLDYIYVTGRITSTFNATTNIGEITAGKYRVSYKNIEGLNIQGTVYDDSIVGSNGNDTLYTWGGNDTINGGNGDDYFSVTLSESFTGQDTIDGGKGDDYLSLYFTDTTGGITSTFNATTNIGAIRGGTNSLSYKNIERATLIISGTVYDDSIVGNNGNDILSTGSGGKDTIDGGKGDDVLSVGYINATKGIVSKFNATSNTGEITAGTYRVSYKNIERLDISDTAYDDSIVGNNGNDTLSSYSGGNDTIIGGAGNDNLNAYSDGNKILNGGSGNDSLSAYGSTGNNTLNGDAGDDTLSADDSKGNNTLNGGAGDDTLALTNNSTGNNLLSGGNGNDLLYLTTLSIFSPVTGYLPLSGTQKIDGGKGDDLLRVNYTNSYPNDGSGITSTFNATTNTGEMTLENYRVSYKNIERLDISGTFYDDFIVGSNGNDTLSAYSGNDTIDGGKGDDIITTSYGNDTLTGGTGKERFVISSLNAGIATITDFSSTDDVLVVQTLFDNLNYTGTNPIADGYIRSIQSGASTLVQFDTDGVGSSASFSTFVILNNFNASNFSQNNLIF
ncbi:MAG: calcium-binding protein [Nostoc sp. ChiSLP02]|nr:calcium-binding protein [Nostoc sp. DedSLP05]MDZ8103302.1 calcium-binding protein [Nostoc sp. DedSLP01]MDZ8187750.1 calcium-binding protein [Nostoc sp. ChiSLP02]